MNVEFSCPHCSVVIEADSTASGVSAECPSCHELVLVPAPGIEPGMVLNGFRIEKKLGGGGMGEVYAATQITMDRKVALKILAPGLMDDPKTVERFTKEARLAAKLDHGNVITVYDAGQAEGFYYLAMSLIDGRMSLMT